MASATRRASYTSSREQQRPWTASGIPALPASRRWFHNCMVKPMSECPSECSMAATVEESTPPDMATAMVLLACIFCPVNIEEVIVCAFSTYRLPAYCKRATTPEGGQSLQAPG